ncbi:DUF3094 family protein [Endozoicomonadaceae bacterium StTr2]
MTTHSRLSEKDQQKVDKFLQQGINETERKPFRPGKLLLWLIVIIVILGALSRFIGYLVVN